jgi:hypothetical protein
MYESVKVAMKMRAKTADLIPGSKEFQDITDIRTAIIKMCNYNNRSALKLAFGEEYDKLYPG